MKIHVRMMLLLAVSMISIILSVSMFFVYKSVSGSLYNSGSMP